MTDDTRPNVHGLPRLSSFRLENPPVVRWAVITPGCQVEIHESENLTAYSPWDGYRVQWRAIHDVNERIDPQRRRSPRQVTRMLDMTDAYDLAGTELGFYYLEPDVPEDMRSDFNNLASLLIALARNEMDRPAPIYGTVLVFGDPPQDSDDPDANNLITSLTDDQIAALHALADAARTAIAQEGDIT